MMPMAALYGMPGHPYGPAMSMPGGGEGRKANKFTHFTYSRRILGAPIGDIWSHNSASSSFSGGDVWPRRFSRRTWAPRQSWRARARRRAGWSDFLSKSRQIPIFCISRSNQSHFTQAWPRWLSPTINTMDLLCLTIIGWSLARMGEEKDVILLIAVKIYFSIKTCRAPSKLPMRQRPPGHKASPPPAKKKSGLGCCSGHFVVIWIILGIVTFGVLLGVVLKFTVS